MRSTHLALWTRPCAVGNGCEWGLETLQVIDKVTRVTHEEFSTAMTQGTVVLMDVTLEDNAQCGQHHCRREWFSRHKCIGKGWKYCDFIVI